MSSERYRRKLLVDAMGVHDARGARDLAGRMDGKGPYVEGTAAREVVALRDSYRRGVPKELLIRANLAQYHWVLAGCPT